MITAVLLALLFAYSPSLSAAETVLPGAHAHNDYHHARPLTDALDQGFCSVEADVFLVDGQLLVGHTPFELRPQRTLEKLYLDPLLERVHQNHGSVHGTGERFTLLVDIKSDASPTTAALAKVLSKYAELLCYQKRGEFRPEAIEVIVSGNRSGKEIASCEPRYFGIDGRPSDVGHSYSVELMPLISESWESISQWQGEGELADADRVKLRQLTEAVHKEGKRLRFWATADKPALWEELHAAGVDVIGTDDLPALAKFLHGKSN